MLKEALLYIHTTQFRVVSGFILAMQSYSFDQVSLPVSASFFSSVKWGQ